jgi:hypothetical protein
VHGWLRERFGPAESPCSYRADRFLKQRFGEMVREAPSEYGRKVLRVLGGLVTKGVYPGEFHMKLAESMQAAHARYLAIRQQAFHRPLRLLHDDPRGAGLTLLQLASSLLGRAVVLLSFLLLPIVAVHALRQKNVVLLLVLVLIIYRALVAALLAFADGRLTTVAYPFHLVNAMVGLYLVAKWMTRPWRRTLGQEPAWAARERARA